MQIISRSDARTLGVIHYFTGEPCKHGHLSERYVNDGKCAQCVRNRVAKWTSDDPERARLSDKKSYERNRARILKQAREYRNANSDEINAKRRKYYKTEKGKAAVRKYRSENKDKINKRKHRYYHNNLEYHRAAKRNDYAKHREKRLADNAIRRIENKDEINKYFRIRRKNDLDFKLSTYIRNMVGRLVKRGYDKTKSTSMILGYTANDLKQHIESQFTKGMSWDNYGEWHIDHIIPIARMVEFGITDPEVVNSLDNLQPLWAKDNLSKGAKLL